MRMEARLQARQSQEMRLAPQMIQSMEILQMAVLDLQAKIAEELEENPVLEVQEKEEGTVTLDTKREEPAPDRDGADDEGKWYEELSSWREGRGRASRGTGDEDVKSEMLANTVARPESLQDFLKGQIALLEIPEEYLPAAEQVIYNLDDGGYLPYTLEQIAETATPPIPIEKLQVGLRIVQSLEPAGVGARDLKECLLLQLKADASPEAAFARDLIGGHLEDIEANRLPKIAKSTGREIEEIKQALRVISGLNPRPGTLYGGTASPRVVPDVVVESVDGRYEVRVENHFIPRLSLSAWHAKRLETAPKDPALKEWLKKKMEAAKWLIEAIVQRQDTLQRVANSIVEAQKGFLDHGIEKLSPLKMQQIADQVGVHVSTVSRAISKKYMQTPRGIFPMKFFFTGGVQGAEGEEGESWVVVRQKVAEIVSREDKKNPLSDGEIADALKKQGLDVARRTIAKYRKMLKIGSSRMRKSY